MHEHLGFLRVSSIVVKVAAWIFLFLGLVGGISVLLGLAAPNPRWLGAVILVIYTFLLLSKKMIIKNAQLSIAADFH